MVHGFGSTVPNRSTCKQLGVEVKLSGDTALNQYHGTRAVQLTVNPKEAISATFWS